MVPVPTSCYVVSQIPNANANAHAAQEKYKRNRSKLHVQRDLLQGIGQVLVLLLHLLLLEELGVTRLGIVDTALSLVLALPAS